MVCVPEELAGFWMPGICDEVVADAGVGVVTEDVVDGSLC